MSDERPLLSLVMIVKNESRSIRETLASVKGHVDRWLVLDNKYGGRHGGKVRKIHASTLLKRGYILMTFEPGCNSRPDRSV